MPVLRNQLYDGTQNILDQRFQSRRENFARLSVCVLMLSIFYARNPRHLVIP